MVSKVVLLGVRTESIVVVVGVVIGSGLAIEILWFGCVSRATRSERGFSNAVLWTY